MAGTTYMRSWQDFDMVSLAIIPLFLFSATFYPLTVYPGWLQVVVRCTPLYQGVALCAASTSGSSAGRSSATPPIWRPWASSASPSPPAAWPSCSCPDPDIAARCVDGCPRAAIVPVAVTMIARTPMASRTTSGGFDEGR